MRWKEWPWNLARAGPRPELGRDRRSGGLGLKRTPLAGLLFTGLITVMGDHIEFNYDVELGYPHGSQSNEVERAAVCTDRDVRHDRVGCGRVAGGRGCVRSVWGSVIGTGWIGKQSSPGSSPPCLLGISLRKLTQSPVSNCAHQQSRLCLDRPS